MNLKHGRAILDGIQWLVTIATGVLALRLNFLQGELTRRIQREGVTQTYAEKILSNLDKLNMDAEQRGTVIIDMLDIITEANLNTGEKPFTDSERQQVIPLRLALATHDADLIAHIGTSKPKLKLWTDAAIESGNDEIKRTALRALAQIGRYRAREAELETFRFCVKKILEISENFSRTPIAEDAIKQFTVLVTATGNAPILLEDVTLKELMQRGQDALKLVVGNAIKEGGEQQQVQPPVPTPSPFGPRPTAFRDRVEASKSKVYQEIAYTADTLNPSDDNTATRIESSRRIELASTMDKTVYKALQQLNDLNLKKNVRPPSAAAKNLAASNIEALKSDDVEVRRKAREDLAAGGAENVPLLLKALREMPNDYRIKVGVSFILSKINEPVSITNAADAALLVHLSGDGEPEVRQYASEFLMRLADPDSVNAVYPELQKAIDQGQAGSQPNENAVYNAVVVLGTWMRTLPDSLAANKKTIADYLDNLASKLPKDKWGKTLGVIKELNAMNADRSKASNVSPPP
jgi:hypothetical protein